MPIYVKQKVKVEDVQHCGYYEDGNTYGNTVKVTLRRGNEWASCAGILIWDEADDNVEIAWDEFKQYALAGEEGYTYWTE